MVVLKSCIKNTAKTTQRNILFHVAIMIDNFDTLSDWILLNKTFDDDTVLFLQIIRRRKENPDARVAQQTVKNFYLKSAEDLLERKDEIVRWCEMHNARAYLRLNVRSRRKIAMQTLALIAQNISHDNYNIKNCYESVAGQYHSDPQKTWIIDLDDDVYPDTEKHKIAVTIFGLIDEVGGNSEIFWVKTKNGMHLITRPFNVEKFTKLLGFAPPYHKDNPTVLYQP